MTKSTKILLTLLALTTIIFIGVGGKLKFEKEQANFKAQLQQEMEDRIAQLKEDLSEQTAGYSVNTGYSTSLVGSLSATATSSIEVASSKLLNEEEITPSYPMYLVIEPNSPNVEIIECWGFASSTASVTWQNCNRGLSLSATGSTSTITGNNKAHSGGAKISQNDVHYIFEQLVDKNTAEAIAGLKEFPQGITIGQSNTSGTIWFNDTSRGYLRYNPGQSRWVVSNDGVSENGLTTTSSIADGGRGILMTAGSGVTSTISNVATGTITSALPMGGGGGLEFFNCRTTLGICDLRVAVSSTSGFIREFATSGGLLAVSSTWFIGTPNGLGGMASGSLVLDFDNQGVMSLAGGLVWETGTSNSSKDVRLYTDPNDSFKLKFGNLNSTDYQFVLGGVTEGNNSSTVPKSFAHGQAVESDGGVLTITHNLGIIPQWIRIDATMRSEGTDTADAFENASGTISHGSWANGESPTRTPLTSTTISQSLAGNASNGTSGFIQSASTTVFLKAQYALPSAVCAGSLNQCAVLANGRVNNVTTSTFQIEWISFLPNFGDAFLQWEMGQ